ncbi:MAG: methyltransferase domain-containing protein [Planctomycetota bacterium]|nr:methyltransferase domain-containing protein [Planctomycetota bacterium]
MTTGLLEEIVGAPDRDDLPGGLGVVSVSDQDEAGFLAEVGARERARVDLVRRGIDHGSWAEIDLEGLVEDLLVGEHAWRQRWVDARPIVLRGQLDDRLPAFAPLLAERAKLQKPLLKKRGIEQLIDAGLGRLDARFDPLGEAEGRDLERAAGGDPERDLARRFLAFAGVPDFWVKSQQLSTTAQDHSVRLRLSFGAERDHDASNDEVRQRVVAALGTALLPETELLRGDDELLGMLDAFDRDEEDTGDLYLTQDIAYWNAPNGGALMHHDAFDEEYEERQRAVVYAQLTGATAWIALSTQELAARVVEFTELIAEGEMPWLRDVLFRGERGKALQKKILKGGRFVYAELERPGCGQLGRIVNRGPEFTSLLADAGHAFFLRAGDVVVLPNHGFGHTTLHSVWCASDEPAYSLSLALRRGVGEVAAPAGPGASDRHDPRAPSTAPPAAGHDSPEPHPEALPFDPENPHGPRFDWRTRYVEDHTPWDLGGPHPGLVAWLEGQGADLPRGRAFVPGCGKGHDALQLARHGYGVDAIDLVDLCGEHFVEQLEALGGSFHVDNVLTLDPAAVGGPWDLCYEHTIFCAIDPSQRPDFGAAMARCVKPGGHLVSFLFPTNKPLDAGGPPHRATPADLAEALGEAFELIEEAPTNAGELQRNWTERRVLFRRV